MNTTPASLDIQYILATRRAGDMRRRVRALYRQYYVLQECMHAEIDMGAPDRRIAHLWAQIEKVRDELIRSKRQLNDMRANLADAVDMRETPDSASDDVTVMFAYYNAYDEHVDMTTVHKPNVIQKIIRKFRTR